MLHMSARPTDVSAPASVAPATQATNVSPAIPPVDVETAVLQAIAAAEKATASAANAVLAERLAQSRLEVRSVIAGLTSRIAG